MIINIIIVVVVVVVVKLSLLLVAPFIAELVGKSTGKYALRSNRSSRQWVKWAASVRGFPEAACLQTYGFDCC